MNLLDLFVKIGVKDETDSKLDNVKEKIGNGLKTAAKVGTAALAATTTAVAALTKASIDQFAEYEQLVGGVDTLFKSSGQQVLQYATNAYKTAGMSANEYMNTITSFAASMKQSFDNSEAGIAAAAEASNQAVIDMADNANKMGTDIGSIQNAYQGFAKQNYTMLDNLKLGYGGTKEEMERLLADANKINATQGKITNYSISSFADVTEAIHVVQTELGITGTTASEASTTISGSLGMVKSAWANLLTGMSGGTEEFKLNQEELMQNLVESVVGYTDETGTHVNGFLDNIIPAVEATLKGVVQIIGGSAGLIPQIITTIIDLLPDLLDAGMQILMALLDGILQNVDKLVEGATQIIYKLIEFLTQNTQQVAESAIQIITALVTGLVQALPQLMAAAPVIIGQLISALINQLPNIVQAGVQFVLSFIEGIMARMAGIAQAAQNIGQSIRNVLAGLGGEAWAWGSDMIVNFINGITAWFGELVNRVRSMAQTVRNYLGFSEPKEGPLSNFHTYAPDMVKLFAQGIKDNEGLIEDAFNNSLDFGVTSPGTFNANGSASGIAAAAREIVLNVTETIDGAILARNQYRFNLEENERHDNYVGAFA